MATGVLALHNCTHHIVCGREAMAVTLLHPMNSQKAGITPAKRFSNDWPTPAPAPIGS